ncbi:hypothetical protein J7T55_012327 [Diaporthe amygdali]|uniref:uncharacterized protein n=1 Tax=Phomopsis amygdali TaxID=1214568 RepID=UPI0022FE7E9A|nr:uncharacterized protein J7T55_012327 [Diaporthe amygdali]KAJ0123856.1 hypothetical protein J7T55_012327 [Diaporthe amygdali]
MSELLKEAETVFREILQGELEKAWGYHLTEAELNDVIDVLAKTTTRYLELRPKKRPWNTASPDRLCVGFRGFITPILEDRFHTVNAFVIADDIAQISSHAFYQVKLIVDDGNNDSTEATHVESDGETNDAADVQDENETGIAGQEEEDGDDRPRYSSFLMNYLNNELVSPTSIINQAEVPVGSETVSVDEHVPDLTGKKKGKATAEPVKKSQQGKKPEDVHGDTDLYYAVANEDKPNGPPKFYKCKIPSCKGFQGTWYQRKRHFRTKHPQEWEDFTGAAV